MVTAKILYDHIKFIMNLRNMKQKIKLKIVKVMRFTSKTKSSHLILSIVFHDKL